MHLLHVWEPLRQESYSSLLSAFSQTVARQNKLLSKIPFFPQVLHSLKHLSLRAPMNDGGLFQITSC